MSAAKQADGPDPRSRGDLRSLLAAGSPRGHGAVPQLVSAALQARDPGPLISEFVDALHHSPAIVQNRAARALKHLQAERPGLLDSFARELLRATLACTDLRARWNLLIVCGNLTLRGANQALAIDLMFERLGSGSALERTFAMQALVNFAAGDPGLRRRVQPIVQAALADPSAAVRARARKLVSRLKR